MTIELLQKLKNLQRARSDVSPFLNPLEFEKWADEVAALLSFNEKLQYSLKHYVKIAKFNSRTGSPNIDQINETIGILNQAIILQETEISTTSKHTPLESPSKITVKWVIEHATWQFYVYVFSALGFAFALGVKYSEITTKTQSENLSIAAPKATNPTNSPNNRATLPSSTITPIHPASHTGADPK